MNKKTIRHTVAATIASAAASATVVACGPNPDTLDPGVHTTVMEPSWAFDPGDQRQLAGWADAIFVGTVADKSGTDTRMPTLPETQFRVTMIQALKGEPPDSVTVNQQGGYVAGKAELVLVDHDPLISAGKSYLFAARYLPEKNWYTIAPRIGDVELTPAELQAVESSLRDRNTAEPDTIQRMRDSIANQIPLRDKRPSQAPATPPPTPPSAPSTSETPEQTPPSGTTTAPSVSPSATPGR